MGCVSWPHGCADSKTTGGCLFPLPRSVLFFLASAFRSSATVLARVQNHTTGAISIRNPECTRLPVSVHSTPGTIIADAVQQSFVLAWFRSISGNGLELDLDLRFEALALVKLGSHHQTMGNHHQTTGDADLLVASDFFCRATSCPGAAMARAGASKA